VGFALSIFPTKDLFGSTTRIAIGGVLIVEIHLGHSKRLGTIVPVAMGAIKMMVHDGILHS
jgi:hypothetical protein